MWGVHSPHHSSPGQDGGLLVCSPATPSPVTKPAPWPLRHSAVPCTSWVRLRLLEAASPFDDRGGVAPCVLSRGDCRGGLTCPLSYGKRHDVRAVALRSAGRRAPYSSDLFKPVTPGCAGPDRPQRGRRGPCCAVGSGAAGLCCRWGALNEAPNQSLGYKGGRRGCGPSDRGGSSLWEVSDLGGPRAVHCGRPVSRRAFSLTPPTGEEPRHATLSRRGHC